MTQQMNRRGFLAGTGLTLSLVGSAWARTVVAAAAPTQEELDSARNGATLLRGVHVVPMDRERLLEHQDVWIRRGRIQSIVPAGTALDETSKVRVVDAKGKFLMPGLADGHPHPPGPEGIDLPLAHYLRLTLAAGVTTLRFARPAPGLARKLHDLSQQETPLPQIYSCAAGLWEPPKDWGRFREELEEARRDGGRLVKILTGIDRSELERVVKIATGAGLPVTGHVPKEVSVFEAIESGMRGIEHTSGYDRLVDDFQELLRAIRASADRKVYNCPDIDWYRIHSIPAGANHSSLEQLRGRAGMQYIPSKLQAAWSEDVEEARAAGSYGSALARKTVTFLMAQAGVPLLVSAGDGAFIVPGFSMLEELRLFEQSGLSRYESLRAATVRMAEFFGEESDWGTVEVGKKALLILLGSNPLTTLDALETVETVIVGDHVLSREQLDTGLASISLA